MSCDMLVKLYGEKIAVDTELEKKLAAEGIVIKRGISCDRHRIREFILARFSENWADEIDSGILNGGCYVAVKDKAIVGVAGWDGLFKGFFGPIGVDESMRGTGIGKALLLRCLCSMREQGYRYAIIGWTGPQEFYAKCCDAVPIPDSIPGSYGDMVTI